jgi:hypothetical protein
MHPNDHEEPLSFCDIDEILRPLQKIRLDRLHPDVLDHLIDQLGSYAHVAGLYVKRHQITNDDHRAV